MEQGTIVGVQIVRQSDGTWLGRVRVVRNGQLLQRRTTAKNRQTVLDSVLTYIRRKGGVYKTA